MTRHSTCEIDKRISDLERELLALKHERNGLAWICRVPYEILAEVFRCIQRGSGAPDEVFPWMTHDQSWSRVMLVCQHFRSVAVQTPTLWDVLDCQGHPREWVDLCVQRSGEVPLFVNDQSGHGAQYIHKARVAQLEGDALNDAWLDAPAPALRVLRLVHGSAPFVLTPSFLGGANTSLTELSLNGAGIFLHGAPMAPVLRVLGLYGVAVHDSLIPLVADVLGHLPNLEDLTVEHLVAGAGPQPNLGRRLGVERLQVPHLRILTIRDVPTVVSALVRIMLVPKQVFHIEIAPGPRRENLAGALGKDHNDVYEAGVAFLRTTLLIPENPCGRIVYDNNSSVARQLATIHFRSTSTPGDTTQELDPYLRCSFTCLIERHHPLLDNIDTVHFVGESGPGEDVDDALGLVFVRGLRTLIIEGCQNALATWEMTSWLSDRRDEIQQVRLIRCSDSLRNFAEELEEGGMLVSWEDHYLEE
jgi:hypothetical protein